MSNPPIPFALAKLRGNPGKRRLRPEVTPVIAVKCPDPPPFVTGYAADEWSRVAPELHRLGLLTIVDHMPLAAYCDAYARWRTAVETIAGLAARDPQTHALLMRTRDGVPRRSPLVKIAADAAADMLAFAGHFALTPIARSRLAAGPNGQPPGGGKFEGLLG